MYFDIPAIPLPQCEPTKVASPLTALTVPYMGESKELVEILNEFNFFGDTNTDDCDNTHTCDLYYHDNDKNETCKNKAYGVFCEGKRNDKGILIVSAR